MASRLMGWVKAAAALQHSAPAATDESGVAEGSAHGSTDLAPHCRARLPAVARALFPLGPALAKTLSGRHH
jgi:hypothetical protein